MVYIYKKIIQEKPYYYLRISKRIKGKIIVKDIACLGSDVSKIEPKLKKLPVIYKKEVRKAYRDIKKYIESEHYLKKIKELKLKEDDYLEKDLLDKVEAIKEHFNKKFLKLDEKTVSEAYKNFLIDFAFNTTSLEGNTITLMEADRLLRENLTPKDKNLREVFDLQNTEKVFFEIINSIASLDNEFIVSVHDKLMENIDTRKGYRQHDIRVFKSAFEATPFVYVKADMGILLKWYRKYEDELHPLALAAIFHQKFEKIHPFSDGNGRTGRMLMIYILMKKKYPPLIIKKSRRADYLNALAKGNNVDLNNIEPKFYKELVNYIAEELDDGYWNNFMV